MREIKDCYYAIHTDSIKARVHGNGVICMT